MPSITINSVTTDVYTAAEVKALLATKLSHVGHIDGVKSKYRLKTFRLFARGKVVVAPSGFTWLPGVTAATTTAEIKTRRLYFDKAQVDALVASL